MLYCIDIGVLQPKKYIVEYKCIASLQVYISILVICSTGFSMVLSLMPFLVWFFTPFWSQKVTKIGPNSLQHGTGRSKKMP